ncbi:MAG TPA: cupin domain-containing protein [Candidatus Limnocylindrales bacterium]|jgi:quercetin dioxygenase-like cupin family protein|nr:cupin domain-containing protein [Candidatus Limnocylindrales bacterium]
MPIEIRRFGVGNRRPDGPPGTTGVAGQPIASDERGTITELAFARAARLERHTNPHVSWLVVIEGGGWVSVGDERARVAAGEAVLWPSDVPHSAWTEHSEMRAFIVEFASGDEGSAARPLEGRATAVQDEASGPLPRPGGPTARPEDAGEPA